jgi:hypothetical protein
VLQWKKNGEGRVTTDGMLGRVTVAEADEIFCTKKSLLTEYFVLKCLF